MAETSSEIDSSGGEYHYNRLVRVVLCDRPPPNSLREEICSSSTFSHILTSLRSLGYPNAVILQANFGPRSLFDVKRPAELEGVIPDTCHTIYAIVNEANARYVLAVVRTSLVDYPLPLFNFESYATVSQAVIAWRPDLADKIKSITSSPGGADLANASPALIIPVGINIGPGSERTNLLVTISETPQRRLDVTSVPIPPFLTMASLRYRYLMRQVPALCTFRRLTQYLLEATIHLVISLSLALEPMLGDKPPSAEVDHTADEPLEELVTVAPQLGRELDMLMDKIEELMDDLRKQNLDRRNIRVTIQDTYLALCRDFPGAVALRHSFHAFHMQGGIDDVDEDDLSNVMDTPDSKRVGVAPQQALPPVVSQAGSKMPPKIDETPLLSQGRPPETPLPSLGSPSDFPARTNHNPVNADKRPLRILTLDGTGFAPGGIFQLEVLGHLMSRIKERDKLESDPLPGDYFDIIGGTSTGGLIAILLGCFRVSVDDCLVIVRQFWLQVFSGRRNRAGKYSTFRQLSLKSCIFDILEIAERGAANFLMSRFTGCKVFVTATPGENAWLGDPPLIRTYPIDWEVTAPSYSVWEAIQATLTSPIFFEPFQNRARTYVDGGFGGRNPVTSAYKEARRLRPGKAIGLIVSLGVGMQFFPPRIVPQIPDSEDWVRLLQRNAYECEVTHHEMSRKADEDLEGRYFRFNMLDGMQPSFLTEYESLGIIFSLIEQYWDETILTDVVEEFLETEEEQPLPTYLEAVSLRLVEDLARDRTASFTIMTQQPSFAEAVYPSMATTLQPASTTMFDPPTPTQYRSSDAPRVKISDVVLQEHRLRSLEEDLEMGAVRFLIGKRDLASLYILKGRFIDAEQLLLEAVSGLQRLLGETNFDTIDANIHLIRAHRALSQKGKAERHLKDVLRILGHYSQSASEHYSAGRYSEAEVIQSQVMRSLSMLDKNQGTLICMCQLARTFTAQGFYAKADHLLVAVLSASVDMKNLSSFILRSSNEGRHWNKIIYGRQNLRSLSCALSRSACPALGWLPPYTQD